MTWRGSASYVTGAHNMKVGYQGSYLANQTNRVRNPTLLVVSLQSGQPNQFTMALDQWQTADRTKVARTVRAGQLDARPVDGAGGAPI